eukprot:11181648-Lingulodinium_polyedra.AAC.1
MCRRLFFPTQPASCGQDPGLLKRAEEKGIVCDDWPVVLPSHLWCSLATACPGHSASVANSF